MRLPPEKIEAFIKAHFDFKTRKGGTKYRINNPIQSDTGRHLEIDITTGACHDWRGDDWVGYNPETGKKYKCTFVRLVQLYQNCSYYDALKRILGEAAAKVYLGRKPKQTEESQIAVAKTISLPAGSRPITGDTSKLGAIIKRWLYGRKYTDEMIKLFDLHMLGMSVVWPYYEFGELVYWQSRDITDKIFQFPPESIGVSKSMFLYGFDNVEPAKYLVITEALICCNTISDQCVACGGASLGKIQIDKIKMLGPRDGIILAGDLDWAGITTTILENAALLEETGYRIMYSLPCHRQKDGILAKDWNDIAKDTNPQTARENLEANIGNLTLSRKMQLRRLAEDLRAKSVPTATAAAPATAVSESMI